jgi:uncharacterized membrane protein
MSDNGFDSDNIWEYIISIIVSLCTKSWKIALPIIIILSIVYACIHFGSNNEQDTNKPKIVQNDTINQKKPIETNVSGKIDHLTIINKTDKKIYLALVFWHYKGNNSNWVSKGWWHFEPNESGTVALPLNRDGYFYKDFYYYAHSEDNKYVWGGDHKFLVDYKKGFAIENADSPKSIKTEYYWLSRFRKDSLKDTRTPILRLTLK